MIRILPTALLCIVLFAGCASTPRYTHSSLPQTEKSDKLDKNRNSNPDHLEMGVTGILLEIDPDNSNDEAVRQKYAQKGVSAGYTETGIASYYSNEFRGRKTANGERFNPQDLTAAHRTLPFNTLVKVTNLSNHLSVVVRINDRGPFKKTRIIDVSYAAAKRIGLIRNGSGKVKITVVKHR
jgi:rare lipoprotein A